MTVLNAGFLQSDQVQQYIYKINWLNIKVLKTAASSKSINLYLFIKKSIVSSATTTYPFWCKLQEVGGTFRNFCLIRVVTRQKNF
jgi:hypothetical protein